MPLRVIAVAGPRDRESRGQRRVKGRPGGFGRAGRTVAGPHRVRTRERAANKRRIRIWPPPSVHSR